VAAAAATRRAGFLRWQRQFPAMQMCAAGAGPAYEEISGFLGKAAESTMSQMESTHFVGLFPSTAAFDTGEAAVSANAYARLPRATGHGPYTTALTKVVLVARSSDVHGLSLADCALTDAAAATWIRDKADHIINGLPLDAGLCSPEPFMTQVPFLNLIFEGKLEGNVLPLVLGDQTAQTAQQVANLLKTLVAQGGPYKHERVLFVMIGDLSRDLEKKWAIPRDKETVDNLVSQTFGDMSTYFGELEKVQQPGEHRRPFDYAIVLAAAKLATDLGLRGSVVTCSNSGDFIGATDRNENDKVRGYASVLFGHDSRPEGQRLSAGPQAPETMAPTTTTTTVAPTVQPPNTVIPADQLSMTPGPR